MLKLGSSAEPMPLASLRPTQLTVGRRMVEQKRRSLAELADDERRTHMATELYPAVRGPDGAVFVLDHHHEASAALACGATDVQVTIVADLSSLAPEAFWAYLDLRGWVHAYDEHGRRQDFDRMPTRFEDMVDDPYRSLASAVLARGGFAKPDEPFFEFLWANHFRTQLDAKTVADDYERAIDEAVAIARSEDSRFLPGWAGPRG